MFEPYEGSDDATPLGCFFTLMMGGCGFLTMVVQEQNVTALIVGEVILSGFYLYLNRELE